MPPIRYFRHIFYATACQACLQATARLLRFHADIFIALITPPLAAD
jgi:hypothetical protein